jgi:hypothetical protein
MSGSGPIRGLTVRQPWAFAISHLGKRVENRTWQSYYRGLIAVHAAAGFNGDDKRMVGVAAELAGVSEKTVADGAATRGAVVAVARLADVCSESLRIGFTMPSACGCGLWAFNQQRHLRLIDVRPLAEPVPCKGALGLWTLPDDVEAAVAAQLGERANA